MDFFVSVRKADRQGGWASARAALYKVPLQERYRPDWLQLHTDPPVEASQHNGNFDQADYWESEEVIPWDAVINPQGGLDLRGLLTSSDTLQAFCSVGHTTSKAFGVKYYVGRLPQDCGDIVFTVKEHPIQDEVAHRDDSLQALRRVKEFHSHYMLDKLPFSYAKGVIEVNVSCETPDLGLDTDMAYARTATYQKLSLFFVYTKPQATSS